MTGKIDPTRLRPAAKRDNVQATLILLGAALFAACCCGASFVGGLWAVVG